MARLKTRPSDEEEIEDVADDDEEDKVSAPAVSDRRRRRQIKRGEITADASNEVDDDGDDDESDAGITARKDRPTPSSRGEVAQRTNIITRSVGAVVDYFKEVQAELLKVTWLNREDTLRLTYIVILVTAVSAAFLGFVSFLFALLTGALATASTSVLAGGITMVLIIVVAGAWLLRDRLFGRID